MAQNTFLRSNALLPKKIKHTSELLGGSSWMDRSDDWHVGSRTLIDNVNDEYPYEGGSDNLNGRYRFQCTR